MLRDGKIDANTRFGHDYVASNLTELLPTSLLFYSIGTHENFYSDLKKYLKEVNENDFR